MGAAVCGVQVSAASASVGAVASASARPAAFTTLTAPMPRFAIAGPVYAEVRADPMTRGASIPLLARTKVTGSSVSIRVPQSALATRLARANGGILNLMVFITNGHQMVLTFVPSRATGTTTETGFGRVARSRSTVSMTRIRTLPAAQAVSPTSRANSLAHEVMTGTPASCIPGYTYQNNTSTRIGQLSVANGTKIHGTYTYSTSADSTMDVGVLQSNGDYSASGTVGVDNSIGAGDQTRMPVTYWSSSTIT